MDKKEIKLILKEGEGYFAEFKQSVSGIEKDIVSFANSSGGRIFLGVTDEGEIKGIKATNRLKSDFQNIARNCDPPIKISVEPLSDAVMIKVREGEDKPYKCSSGFYKRIGANSQKMTRSEILNFFKSEGKVRFDEMVNDKFKYPKDFSREKLCKYLELAGLSKTLSNEKLLASLGVSENQGKNIYLNNAGVLFFAKEPQRIIPWSVFTVALFKDTDGVDIIDRKEITGGLFEVVAQVMDFVKLYAKVAYRITGKPQRDNIYEYPFEAIREAVINSVMHKDYFEHGHNNILKFFPDRIRLENIWHKPDKFVLGKTVFRRNHLVADLFSRIHFGEKMGSGMKRMRNICKKGDAPYPKIEYTNTHFYVVFRQSKEYMKMTEAEKNVPEKAGEHKEKTREKIIDFIKTNPRISIQKLASKMRLTEKAIEWQIKRLKNDAVLERIGPDKGGYWEVGKSEEKAVGRVDKQTGENREKTREETREKIIGAIRVNPHISMQELANQMRLTEKGVEWQIKILKKTGALERIGPDKGGYWKVPEK